MITQSKPNDINTNTETKLMPVHLHILLDRSGSMQGFEQDVIGGFNSFLEKQRQVEGECGLTLVQFDGQDPFEVIYDALELETVPILTRDKYWPRGNTPLWDAVGRLINSADNANVKNSVDNIVWIFTDGYENASKEFSAAKVRELIQQKEEQGWTFIFMGCDIDAYAQGGQLGVSDAHTMNFVKDETGYQAAWGDMERSMSSYRSKDASGRLSQRDDMFEGVKNSEEDWRSRT
ncbi:MAG: hypothetical protein P8J01_03820 [Acidimicrobiales bacterium]|nr:hypothetical protein [Acidimicrobiales bacterium]